MHRIHSRWTQIRARRVHVGHDVNNTHWYKVDTIVYTVLLYKYTSAAPLSLFIRQIYIVYVDVYG